MKSPLTYKTKLIQETLGHGSASLCVSIECIENLNATIDALFEVLDKTGNASLLEDLCPYFGCLWPSAHVLANALCTLGAPSSKNVSTLSGARLLELGCGLALPSLVASKLQASVLATDFHPEVPLFLERNLKHNSISNLEYLRVDWRSELPPLEPFDFIVGSDVLYEREHSLRLARVIDHYLKPNGQVLIADPARPYLQSFTDEMKRRGFESHVEIHTAPAEPKPQDVFLVSFQKI